MSADGHGTGAAWAAGCRCAECIAWKAKSDRDRVRRAVRREEFREAWDKARRDRETRLLADARPRIVDIHGVGKVRI